MVLACNGILWTATKTDVQSLPKGKDDHSTLFTEKSRLQNWIQNVIAFFVDTHIRQTKAQEGQTIKY